MSPVFGASEHSSESRGSAEQFHLTQMNLALIGPSGAGKGTQAAQLVARFSLLCISTGDLFRDHLKNKTELGALIQDYLDKGELVPDRVADATLEEWLRVSDPGRGILFDGYPRTVRQAKFLERLMFGLELPLTAVVHLSISDEEVIHRLSERQGCRVCQAPFHKTSHPFQSCPYNQCQGEHLVQRGEDDPERILTRLRVFHQETEPLISHYHEMEKLVEVDAARDVAHVTQSILQSLQRLGKD